MRCHECGQHVSHLRDPKLIALVKDRMPMKFLSKKVKPTPRGLSYVVRAREFWLAAFGSTPAPNQKDVAALGHALEALGWERTFRRGTQYYVITLEDFEDVRDQQ